MLLGSQARLMIAHCSGMFFFLENTLCLDHFIILNKQKVALKVGNEAASQQVLNERRVLILLKHENSFLMSMVCQETMAGKLKDGGFLLHIIFPTNGQGYIGLSFTSPCLRTIMLPSIQQVGESAFSVFLAPLDNL